jgi:hypothetical protein
MIEEIMKEGIYYERNINKVQKKITSRKRKVRIS